jgi:hypothetical protein
MDDNLSRALRSGLYVVEKNLRAITQLLDQPQMQGITYSLGDNLDVSSGADARVVIQKMMRELELLKKTFSLPVEAQSSRSRVYTCLGEIWVTLCECKSDRIQGHGPLVDSDKAFLDQHIDSLLTLLERLEQALIQNGNEIPPGEFS